ncbi:hypothetical protein Tco_1239587 [Tanacetum coccineum]
MVVAERYRLQLSMGSRSGREFYFKLSPIVKARSVIIMQEMIKGLPIILNDYIRGHELLQGGRGKMVWSDWLADQNRLDQLDYKKANKESRLQIAKDRKKDRAYIPPLNLFEDHSHDDSFYSDEENFEGLDYEDAHLGFDPEKSLKFHY